MSVPSAEKSVDAPWTAQDADRLYGVSDWGAGYFSINDDGQLCVHPQRDPQRTIVLEKLVQELHERDLEPPVLIRFTDILRDRLEEIYNCFSHAIRECEYDGRYRLVYPIKVNQQRHVVEDVLQLGRAYGYGLEAGSKPELLAIMAMVDDNETPIVCNGFKDDQFIEAVVLAAKMGRRIIPVVERLHELDLIIRYAKLHDVRPTIGLRVKLATRGAGRWEQSGGQRSKFGLFPTEMLRAVEKLREHDMLESLQMLHCHLGSQISNIQQVKKGVVELSRMYVQLRELGAAMSMIDVGGGLAVDYQGSQAEQTSSMNYTLQEYANDVVFYIREVCEDAGVPHPEIISESGRALVACHSVLVCEVVGSTGIAQFERSEKVDEQLLEACVRPVQLLHEIYHELNEDNANESLHDAQLQLDEVLTLFNLGYCTLQDRALGESLFYGISAKLQRISAAAGGLGDDFDDLDQALAHIVFCNFSLFQSLPDSWAIDQIFPILPIHRLNEKPTIHAVLADMTCDSDGKIDHFIDTENGQRSTLDLHELNGDRYLIAACFVGAYQEILGDLHNLFGDVNAVHVEMKSPERVHITRVVEGDTIGEVLSYVQYDIADLRSAFRHAVEDAIAQDKLTLSEGRQLRRFYEQGLAGYTYLT